MANQVLTDIGKDIAICPIVRCAIVFKTVQNQAGVFIELEEDARYLHRTKAERAKAIEVIWPFIERITRSSPTHLRLEKHSVILVHPDRPLPRTPEGAIRHSAALELYARDIEQAHLSHTNGSSPEIGIEPHKSQEATYDIPATRRLTQLVGHLSRGINTMTESPDQSIEDTRAMIRKYDRDWPRQEGRIVQPVEGARVVVTGTTGALGSHLLAQLLESNRVEKVWATNRKSSKGNTKERQIESFRDKLLDINLLNSEKLVFVDADLEDLKLGLMDEMYNEIRREATTIIHNAWPVNFSSSLETFEPNIRGTSNLLDLAFNSVAPTGLPRFAFTSSLSVTGFDPPGRRLNESPVSVEDVATKFGYGQGKLVTEKLLESANRAGLQTCVVRLGQLAGDISSGSWSITDWVPSLVRSSISVGCLPGALGVISWLPLDVAAHSIIDICVLHNSELPMVVHVSHPRPVSWMSVIYAFSSYLSSHTGSQLPIICFSEWNKRVVEAAASFQGSKRERYKMFPITKLQRRVDREVQVDEELRSRSDAGDAEFGGLPSLDTTVAGALSETLRSTPQLGMQYVEKWVEYWESMGFFKPV